MVSFEPKTGTYRIRAWNSGNTVDTEFKVGAKEAEWSFQSGPVTFVDRMRIDEQGRWYETSEGTMADGRKVHSVKMLLTRQ